MRDPITQCPSRSNSVIGARQQGESSGSGTKSFKPGSVRNQTTIVTSTDDTARTVGANSDWYHEPATYTVHPVDRGTAYLREDILVGVDP